MTARPEPVVAVVPAGGASRRFGRMKLVADVGGVPLLQRTLQCLIDAAIPRVVVVAAADHDLSSVPLIDDPRVVVITNPDPDRGMFSSVQAGLSAADPAQAVVVLPGDMPFVRAATVDTLMEAHRVDGAAVVAAYAGKRGHPIVIPASARERLLEQPATITLKDALARVGVVLREVAVDDPGVLRDVDVPGDLP